MYTFCPFLGQIYSQKTENIAKKEKFSIKYGLRAIKNFQNYLKKLGEIGKSNNFEGQNWPIFHPGDGPKGPQKFSYGL